MKASKGRIPWNKGLTKEDPRVKKYCFNKGNFQKGQHNSPETQFKKGNKPWNKGIPRVEWMSEEGHKNVIKALKEYNENHGPWNKKEPVVLVCKNCGTEFNVKPSEKDKIFCSRSCLGDYMRKHPISKTHLPEVREKISKTDTMLWKNAEYRDKKTGENHPNWEGGSSFEPYPIEFNALLRRKIRKRDNYTCQLCGRQQEELGHKLDIHHIDHNKTNNSPSNLISLCRSCHISQHWKERHEETTLQEVLVSA